MTAAFFVALALITVTVCPPRQRIVLMRVTSIVFSLWVVRMISGLPLPSWSVGWARTASSRCLALALVPEPSLIYASDSPSSLSPLRYYSWLRCLFSNLMAEPLMAKHVSAQPPIGLYSPITWFEVIKSTLSSSDFTASVPIRSMFGLIINPRTDILPDQRAYHASLRR